MRPTPDDALQLLAEPRRREILRLVWDRELCAGDIAAAFSVSFGAVSQHLAKLRTAGFVDVRRAGRHRYYRARPETLGPLRPFLETLWSEALARLEQLAEAREKEETP